MAEGESLLSPKIQVKRQKQVDKRMSVTSELKDCSAGLIYPITAAQALKKFRSSLNDFEVQEVTKFDGAIYYCGQLCRDKIRGHVIKMVQSNSSNLGAKPCNAQGNNSSRTRRQSARQPSSTERGSAIPSEV